jgi:hypothetical protein
VVPLQRLDQERLEGAPGARGRRDSGGGGTNGSFRLNRSPAPVELAMRRSSSPPTFEGRRRKQPDSKPNPANASGADDARHQSALVAQSRCFSCSARCSILGIAIIVKYWRGDYVTVFPEGGWQFHRCVLCDTKIKFANRCREGPGTERTATAADARFNYPTTVRPVPMRAIPIF